ncbi:hypothetical protein [Brevundimonas nasdae]|uniref:hypothetical protein n=1 Tax=Brevundimonas nasdae TaxID=172043 RepID=UPI003F68E0FF
MTRDQLMNASDGVMAIVVMQGEKRLEGQCAFAEVQDARGGALVGASVSLSAAAVAVAVGGAQLVGLGGPVSVGAVIATLGFSLSALLALWSGRACNFHAPGWYPNDFKDDIATGRTVRDLEVDFALDLQHRLSQNRTALIRRGDLYNWATYCLLGTPIAALVAGLLAA